MSKFKTNKKISKLEYTLRFALHVIEREGLENEISENNWNLGESLRNEIDKEISTKKDVVEMFPGTLEALNSIHI